LISHPSLLIFHPLQCLKHDLGHGLPFGFLLFFFGGLILDFDFIASDAFFLALFRGLQLIEMAQEFLRLEI
jgi:hypothetical protein